MNSMKRNVFIIFSIAFAALILLAFLGWRSDWISERLKNSSNLEKSIHIYVQAPPEATVGEEINIVLLVKNDSQDYIQLDEIRFPRELLQASVVTGIFPGNLSQTHYESATGFLLDYYLSPNESLEIIVSLLPRKSADLMSTFEIISAKQVSQTNLHLIFREPVALAPTDTPTSTSSPTPTETPLPPTRTATPVPIPFQALVQLTAKIKHSSYLRPLWGGSGAIISPDGLILTNAHLVDPDIPFEPDFFIISLTLREDEPPVDSFIAEPVSIDKDLDLALLQITTDLHYKPIDPNNLNLPSVPLGDSDSLKLGDPLIILGYPAIGGDTITLTRGSVGGFTQQRKYGERAFIKTSATLSGGTSGGIVLDAYGRMVAVPTQLGSGNEENLIDCQYVADTNLDGVINTLDTCVPVGGYINALRPINLAQLLLEGRMDIKSTQAMLQQTITATGQ